MILGGYQNNETLPVANTDVDFGVYPWRLWMQLLLNAFCDWWTNASGRRCGFWRKVGRISIPTFWWKSTIEICWNMAWQGIFKKHSFLYNGLRNWDVILHSILFLQHKTMITALNLDAQSEKKSGGTAFVPDLQQAWWRSVFKSNQVIGFLSSWRPGTNDSMQPLWQLPESEHLEGFHAINDALPEINGGPLGG